jgi:hypothetical protein
MTLLRAGFNRARHHARRAGSNPNARDFEFVSAVALVNYYPNSGIDDTLGGPFDRRRRFSLGQRRFRRRSSSFGATRRASFLAHAWPAAKIFRQSLSFIPLFG